MDDLESWRVAVEEVGEAFDCISVGIECVGDAVEEVGEAVECVGEAVECIGEAVECIGEVVEEVEEAVDWMSEGIAWNEERARIPSRPSVSRNQSVTELQIPDVKAVVPFGPSRGDPLAAHTRPLVAGMAGDERSVCHVRVRDPLDRLVHFA